MRIITADIHAGQTFSEYKPTTVERVEKANRSIDVLARFCRDHRHRLKQMLILGDLCQYEGERAADRHLELQQLRKLGAGLQGNDALVRYVAGSADPYFDPTVVKMGQGNFHAHIADALGIEASRLNMAGLAHMESSETGTTFMTHGHLPEYLTKDPTLYAYFLKHPGILDGMTRDTNWVRTVHECEEKHQKKGMVYERGYRTVISKLPNVAGTLVDSVMKGRQLSKEKKFIAAMPLPDDSTLLYGHTHAAMLEEIGGTLVANPGTLTGAFRLNRKARGTFLSEEDDEAGKKYTQWEIVGKEYRPVRHLQKRDKVQD